MKIQIKLATFLFVAATSFVGLFYWLNKTQSMKQDPNFIIQTTEFRSLAEERLRSPTGWLAVVGLHWFTQPKMTLGSSADNNIVLPGPVPAQLGFIEQNKNDVFLTLNEATFTSRNTNSNTDTNSTNNSTNEIKPILIDDEPAKTNKKYRLSTDKSGKPTQVNIGPVTFFAIERKNGVGLRVRDENAKTRKEFTGRQWYPPQQSYVVNANWQEHETEKTLIVPDILGNLNEEKSPGFARFEIDGKLVEMHPTREGDKLFFVFRDQTSGKTSYGAARFLYADLPVNGQVTLDFNKSVNPPCAFTNYATCPMPPKENILGVSIAAGEMIPAAQ
jgi:uncharacterized protein (DUF1684 family)